MKKIIIKITLILFVLFLIAMFCFDWHKKKIGGVALNGHKADNVYYAKNSESKYIQVNEMDWYLNSILLISVFILGFSFGGFFCFVMFSYVMPKLKEAAKKISI